MSVIDLQDQREARRRARFEEFCTAQERALAETWRMIDQLVPLIEQWLEDEKKERARRPRGPRCEAPRCRDTITTLHAIPGLTAEEPRALIAMCDRHLCAVRYGRARVTSNGDDTLTWRFRPVGGTPWEMTVPRKRGRRART